MQPTSVVKAALSIFVFACVVPAAACGGDAVDFPAPTPSGNSGGASPSSSASSSSGALPGAAPTTEADRPVPSTTALSASGAESFAACSFDGARIAELAYGGLDAMARRLEETWAVRLRRPGVTVTQAQVDACVAQLRDGGCGNGLGSYLCEFRGTLADGTGCRDGLQCASGSCTAGGPPDGSGATQCGVCTSGRALGETCDAKDLRCRGGLYCEGGTCKATSAVGEPCATARQCAGRTYCAANGKCAPLLPEGSTCSIIELGGGALTSGCDGNMRCIERVCAKPPPLKLKAIGESCADEPGVIVLCHLGACDKATKACVPKATNNPEIKDPEEPCP